MGLGTAVMVWWEVYAVCLWCVCRILFGFMTVTCFLSMWLSNTACAAMMIPIACAVLKELDDHRKNMRQRHAGLEQSMYCYTNVTNCNCNETWFFITVTIYIYKQLVEDQPKSDIWNIMKFEVQRLYCFWTRQNL